MDAPGAGGPRFVLAGVLPQARNSVGTTIEAHSIDYIPLDERTGRTWHQAVFWFLSNFNPVTLAIGFLGPQLGLSFWWTVLSCGLGLFIGTAFMALHASQGPRLGLPQMIQSRAQFGYLGAFLTLLLVFFTLIVFCVINNLFIENGLEGLYGYARIDSGIAATVLATGLAILGYKWIHRIFRIAFFVSLPLWVALTVGTMFGYVGHTAQHGRAAGGLTLVGFMTMFSVGASYNLVSAPVVSDFTRYLRPDTSFGGVVAAVYTGAVASALWLIALGAWLGVHLNVSDPLVAINSSGNQIVPSLGTVTTLVSCGALVAATALVAYSADLVLITGLNSIRRTLLTRRLRVGILVVLGVLWGVVSVAVLQTTTAALDNSLNLILYILTPWTAINLADYFFIRKGRYSVADLFSPGGIYRSWRWQGLVSYGIAIAAMIPFVASLTFYKGPFAEDLGGVDLSFFVGLLFAAASYLVFARLDFDKTAENAVIDAQQ